MTTTINIFNLCLEVTFDYIMWMLIWEVVMGWFLREEVIKIRGCSKFGKGGSKVKDARGGGGGRGRLRPKPHQWSWGEDIICSSIWKSDIFYHQGGGPWQTNPLFICGNVTKLYIWASVAAQGGSLHDIVFGDYTAVQFYIIFNPKYLMVLGSEGIWTMERAFGPGQCVCGEETQG